MANIPDKLIEDIGNCSICGDDEPFHVHSQGKRIENYFTVGRGQTDFQAADAWKKKYLDIVGLGDLAGLPR